MQEFEVYFLRDSKDYSCVKVNNSDPAGIMGGAPINDMRSEQEIL